MPIKPGSMGRPLPGITAAILNRDTGNVETAGRPGLLALRSGWPSMFCRYIDDEQRYRQCFSGDWYLSGDLARVDSDGYFWFCGRADDVIKTAGHIVGPFEVESVLTGHPAVAEAAVFGRPDSMLGEMVAACVILKAGIAPSERLRRELLAFARAKLGPALAPRQIDFKQQLPRNKAGKVMRRVLKDLKDREPEKSAANVFRQAAKESPAHHCEEKRGQKGEMS
jgi:acetyl-CoA synthetase